MRKGLLNNLTGLLGFIALGACALSCQAGVIYPADDLQQKSDGSELIDSFTVFSGDRTLNTCSGMCIREEDLPGGGAYAELLAISGVEQGINAPLNVFGLDYQCDAICPVGWGDRLADSAVVESGTVALVLIGLLSLGLSRRKASSAV